MSIKHAPRKRVSPAFGRDEVFSPGVNGTSIGNALEAPEKGEKQEALDFARATAGT
jgi:hypothetical protein